MTKLCVSPFLFPYSSQSINKTHLSDSGKYYTHCKQGKPRGNCCQLGLYLKNVWQARKKPNSKIFVTLKKRTASQKAETNPPSYDTVSS